MNAPPCVQMTNGAGDAGGGSAGQTRTPSSTPLLVLNVWSVKPEGSGRSSMLTPVDIFSFKL